MNEWEIVGGRSVGGKDAEWVEEGERKKVRVRYGVEERESNRKME